MPATTNKQRLLNQLFSLAKKMGESKEVPARPVLEQFIYGLCREGATRALADKALRSLGDRFFDWNEVRVSSPRELEEALADLPDAEARAQRLIALLQEVFETTFSYDLEPLHKKGLKQAAKQLSRYQAANDYVVAWVVQQSLGGHAIPLDAPTLRTLRRLGLVDGDQPDPEALRASLEHLIPKARGPQFSDVVSNVAHEYCWEENPNCPACPLAADCPTGQENCRAASSPGRAGRPKPR
jgi:endonuclease III